MKSEGLVVFFKSPEIGKVKTRLARDVGEANALAVYKKLLDLTKSVCGNWLNQRSDREVVYYGTGNREQWERIFHNSYKLQMGRDLGERMYLALREELKIFKKVCIIGTDLPELSVALLNQAFAQLDRRDTVIGPSFDGGYYLIGSAKVSPHLLSNLIWSSEHTLKDTIQRIEGFHMSYSYLPTHRDIDTFEDLDFFPEFKRSLI